MAQVVECPRCRQSYRVTAAVIGRRLRCQQCGESFDVVASADGTPQAVARAAPAPQDVPEDGHAAQPGRLMEVERVHGVLIIRLLTPRINSENVEQVGGELLALVDDPAVTKVVLNLGNVAFLFSTALGKIVALEKRLQTHGGCLRLCNLQPLVHQTLETAGLTILFAVFKDESQALAGF